MAVCIEVFRVLNISCINIRGLTSPANIRYASLKLMPRFENTSVAGPEFRGKRKRGRPKRERGRSKRERGRYVSEAAPRFGNLCVRTQRSSKEAFRFFGKNFPILGRSLPIFGRSLPVCGGVAPQTHFRKAFRIAASILKTCTVYCENSPP